MAASSTSESESVTLFILVDANVKEEEEPYLFTKGFLKEKKVVAVQGPMKFAQYLVADKILMCQRECFWILVIFFE